MDERRLFGQIAIDLQFIDQAKLLAALDHQVQIRRAGKGHKLLGVILVEMGLMTPEQVFEVLQTFEQEDQIPGAGVTQVVMGRDGGSATDTVQLDGASRHGGVADTMPLGATPADRCARPGPPGAG